MTRHTPLRALLTAFPLLLAACFAAGQDYPPDEETEVSVLFVHGAADTTVPAPAMRIRALLAETQAVFTASNTRVRLVDAGIHAIPFTPEERLADLRALVRRRDGRLDTVHALRDRAGADLVVLVSSLPNATVNASLLAADSTAFVIVAWDHFGAPVHGLAHELGHLFGAMHEGTTGPVAERFPQGYPYADDSIRTVIALGDQKPLPYFSNPSILHGRTPLGIPGKADIAAVIRTTAPYIAGFRGAKPRTDFVPPGTVPSLDFSE